MTFRDRFAWGFRVDHWCCFGFCLYGPALAIDLGPFYLNAYFGRMDVDAP